MHLQTHSSPLLVYLCQAHKQVQLVRESHLLSVQLLEILKFSSFRIKSAYANHHIMQTGIILKEGTILSF